MDIIVKTIMKQIIFINKVYLNVFIFLNSDLTTKFFFISIFSGALLSFFIFLIFWLSNQNAIFKKQ